MEENEKELKSLLMKVKEESEKVRLNSPFRKLRSWHPVASLHGKHMWKQCQTLFWEGSKITADADCSHEIKRCLLFGRKVMTNLVQFSSVQSLSHVRLFVTPWTAVHEASLSITNSWSPPIPMSIESVMLILCRPLLPVLNLSQHQGLLKWVSSLHQVAKVLEFQLQHQSFQWTPRTDLL